MGSCMKECAWPCSHDCHTLKKMGGMKERGIAQGGLKCSAAHRLLALCFFFFFSLMLSADRKKAVTRDFHREKDEL